jgi:ribosomal protein S18 acetylase RimI-like enzyme
MDTINNIDIVRLEVVTDQIVEAFGKLIPQLVNDRPAPTKEQLESVVSSDNSLVFIARQAGRIIGTFSMVVYRIPTGIKASVEDVVADSSVRGKGVGEAMLRYAVKYAADMGVSKLDLTSKPSRIAANALYRKIGFELRETNVYRLEIHTS